MIRDTEVVEGVEGVEVGYGHIDGGRRYNKRIVLHGMDGGMRS